MYCPVLFLKHSCTYYSANERRSEGFVNLPSVAVQVQRPVTETAVDWDDLFHALERDALNEKLVYVAGLSKSLTQEALLQRFREFGHVESVLLPRDPSGGKHRRYGFISESQ